MSHVGPNLLDGGRTSAAALAEHYRWAYRGDAPPTVGIEEELILVESGSLDPVESVDPIRSALGDRMFVTEFRSAQLELVIPPRLAVADLCRELASARARVVDCCQGGMRLLAAGTHPCSAGPMRVTDSLRYREMGRDYAWATRRGLPSGLHVHVAIADPDDALAIYNASRSWLPELSALASNSPFLEGADSGLASSRLKLLEDLPRSGIPPVLESWYDLAAFASWGAGGGAFPDLGYLWWDLRLRPEYGTLEFRFADTQTTVDDTAAVAAICQSLVATLGERLAAGDRLPVVATHVINENRWLAIRDGLDARLIDPLTGAVEPVRDRLARLLLELEPHAASAGCADELAHAWSLLACNGAARQRAIGQTEGLGGVLHRLVEMTEEPWSLALGNLTTAVPTASNVPVVRT